jgi:murein tripeptide amidase MpaA
MLKKAFLLAILLPLFSGLISAQDYWTTHVISVEKNQENLNKLSKMGLDFLMERDNRVYVVVQFAEIPKLQENNIPYILETFNFFPFRQTQSTSQGGVNGDYHSYGELEQDLFALEESSPNLVRISVIGLTHEGRNIYALKISDNVHSDEDEAEVLIIGCHHAREWISVEIPYLLAEYLVENYATDSQVRDLVDQSEIWIVPLLNPDGLQYSIHFYRYWRKNRRNNGDGTYGVDLNRNYGYQWGYDNIGSSPFTSSGIYRGPSAFSEPETQAIRDLFMLRNFSSLISYHSYSQVILYPWGYTDLPPPDDALLDQIATDMSTQMQAVNGTVYEFFQAGESFYFTNGDTTDWSYGVYGIPSYTIELPPIDELHGGFFNAEEDIQEIFNENLPALLYFIDWTIQNPVSSGGPIKPIRRIPGKKFKGMLPLREDQVIHNGNMTIRISIEQSSKNKSSSTSNRSVEGEETAFKNHGRKQKEIKMLKE